MKVLLDEDLPHLLIKFLPGHEAQTAWYAGLMGLPDGEVLRLAEAAGFDALITSDKKLEKQQNLSLHKIALVILSAQNWPIISPHLSVILAAIADCGPSTIQRVDCGRFRR